MFDQIPNESEIMDRFRQGAQKRGMFAQIIGIFGIIFVIALIVLGVCVIKGFWMIDTQGANRVLQEQGYKNIQITGYRWFTCDKSDYFHTGWKRSYGYCV